MERAQHGIWNDDLLTRLFQEDSTVSSTERRWTPVSDASESFASYLVDPTIYAVSLPVRSHASSDSWGTSTDAGEIWRSEAIDSTNYLHRQRGSASPNTEASYDQRQRPGGVAARDPLAFPRPYVPKDSLPYSWSLDGGILKPSPKSPGLLVPQDGMSAGNYSAGDPGIRNSGNYEVGGITSDVVIPEDGVSQETHGGRSSRGLSQSPSFINMTLNDSRASLSPTPRIPSLSPPDKTANPAHVKRPKVRRKAHNVIEKRYRIRLNDKIAELRDSIPALRVNPTDHSGGNPGDGERDVGCEVGAAHKVNKANVLEKATEYIKSLERSNRRLQAELHRALVLSRDNHDSRPGQPVMTQYSLEPSIAISHPTPSENHAFHSGTYMYQDV